MLKKLVQSLYSAFDKDPHGVVAMRISHSLGASWVVENRTLTIDVEGGSSGFEIPLSYISFSELSALVQDLGFGISYFNSDLHSAAAFRLLDGAGTQSSGSDSLSAYTSTLWGILDAVAVQLETAGGQIEEAIAQISIITASAEYLDDWGLNLGVPRLPNMSDADYREWIITEVSRLRLSPGGIEQAVKGATGYTINIHEPWMDIFKLDGSALSGGDAFYDGDLIDYHTIRPEAFGYVDWDLVLPIIDRNRAAGIGVLTPQNVYAFAYDASDATCSFVFNRVLSESTRYPDVPLLSYMELGDVPVLNNEIMHIRDYRYPINVEAPIPTVTVASVRSYREYFFAVSATRATWDFLGGAWANNAIPWPSHNYARPAVHVRS